MVLISFPSVTQRTDFLSCGTWLQTQTRLLQLLNSGSSMKANVSKNLLTKKVGVEWEETRVAGEENRKESSRKQSRN